MGHSHLPLQTLPSSVVIGGARAVADGKALAGILEAPQRVTAPLACHLASAHAPAQHLRERVQRRRHLLCLRALLLLVDV